MNKPAILALLSLLIIFQSCNRKLAGSMGSQAKLDIVELDFDYFSARSKLKIYQGKKKERATAHIRIKKDSLIWFAITGAVGYEGARAKITQDSLVMIDRINKQVVRYSFKDLSERFNFRLSYNLLQSIILGEMPYHATQKDQIVRASTYHAIRQSRNGLVIDNNIGLETKKLEKLLAVEQSTSNTLELRYENFKEINEFTLAHKALLFLSYQKNGQLNEFNVDIEHGKTQIEEKPLKFPFNIPKRYERK